MLRNSIHIVVVLLIASQGVARAQLGGPALPALAVAAKKLVPGSWARYAVINKHSSQGLLVYLAALERAGDSQWFEMAITDGQRRTLVMRTLVRGLRGKGKLRVVEAIVQPPGQRALRLPAELAAKQRVPIAASSQLTAGKPVGKERVRVPAGSFETTHFRRGVSGRQEHTWLAGSLGTWPLVRYQLGPLTIELVTHGKQANTRIYGKPLKMDKRLLKQLTGVQR